MMIVVVIVADGDAVVVVDNDSLGHATTRNTMNEKGGRSIINAKSFIVIMSSIMIFKIKVKNEKGMLVGKDKF